MQSIWSESCKFYDRNILDSDIKVDIAVIGAGMAGVLTAFMLKERGFDVVVIEANEIAGGATKNTTAKITSQHRLIYNKLINNFGVEKANQYAVSNQLAIEKYAEIIKRKDIECEFERKPAYVYSLDNLKEIEEEVKATNKLGINSKFTDKTTLPFDIKGAIRFDNQAQFNPLKFIKSISSELKIYEHTIAKEINEDVIVTDRGNVRAKLIVVTTHFPFVNNPGYYFLRMYQQRSYVIALENTAPINTTPINKTLIDGMYIDENEKGYSFRSYKDFILLGGAGHRTGKNEQGGCYEKLRTAAKEFYPSSIEKYYWSAQDCMTLDGVPYIGHYSSSTPTLYVATGFNKWGMTNSMVSAMIISDMITGKNNDYMEIFSPQRFNITASAKNLLEDGVQAVSGMIIKKLEIPEKSSEHLQNGYGDIVECSGEKVGVYKNIDGEIFAVNIKCPHLGCQLEWNQDELSWDCPCHGSRFDYNGNLIDNPAIIGLYGK